MHKGQNTMCTCITVSQQDLFQTVSLIYCKFSKPVQPYEHMTDACHNINLFADSLA